MLLYCQRVSHRKRSISHEFYVQVICQSETAEKQRILTGYHQKLHDSVHLLHDSVHLFFNFPLHPPADNR